MSLEYNKNKRLFYIVLKRRTGINTWASAMNITGYFINPSSEISLELKSDTIEGRIIQESTTLLFNNIRGSFNENTDTNSLWYHATPDTYFIYHSRITVYDFREFEPYNDAEYGEEPTGIISILDGLIATYPTYNVTNNTVTLQIASRLDILREHYLTDNYLGRVFGFTSQSILKKCIDLLTVYYADLNIYANGGLVRRSIFYEDIVPYNKNLLELLYEVIEQGGSVGGLTATGDFFVTYLGFSSTVTRQRLAVEADSVIVYHFDSTDYASGAGTSIDDKTSNGYNGIVDTTVDPLTDAPDITWDTEGFFSDLTGSNYGCNGVFFYNEYEGPSYHIALTDFTVDIVFNIREYLVKQNTHSKNPQEEQLVVFSENDEPTNARGFPFGVWQEKALGLNINPQGMLYWETSISDGLVATYFELFQLLSENQYVYLSLTYDSTNEVYKIYMDGTLRKTFTDNTGPKVSSIILRKIVVSNFQFTTGYVSQFRLSNTTHTDAQVFATNEKLYGQEFLLGENTFTYKNYDTNQLMKIVKYSSGVDQVKNVMLYDDGADYKGVLQFAWNEAISFYNLSLIIDNPREVYENYGAAEYDFQWGGVRTYKSLIDLINSKKALETDPWAEGEILLKHFGLTAELGGPLGVYSQSVILYLNGKFDYRRVGISGFSATDHGMFFDTSKYIGKIYSGGTKSLVQFSSAESPSNLVSKDQTSITKYGARIKTVENHKLLNETLDKKTMLDNILASLKDAKKRVTIQVPFRHQSIKIFDKIVLSLEKFNTKQIPHHTQEGGWQSQLDLSGVYRTETFYVVGIIHSMDGTVTTLKLIEV